MSIYIYSHVYGCFLEIWDRIWAMLSGSNFWKLLILSGRIAGQQPKTYNSGTATWAMSKPAWYRPQTLLKAQTPFEGPQSYRKSATEQQSTLDLPYLNPKPL